MSAADQRKALIVVGLAFGDCGKGSIVDYLVHREHAHTVVRFNGGPQAGHNVVTSDGRHHTFSQFGSGTLVPGVRTLLSRFMLIEPYALLNEAAHLHEIGVADAMDRLMIDARCVVITPAQQAANRLREIARGAAAHGTCGLGIGETMSDRIEFPKLAVHARDLREGDVVAKKLRATCRLKVEQLREEIASLSDHPRARTEVQTLLDPRWIEVAVDNYAAVAGRVAIVEPPTVRGVFEADGAMLFEGAQGVLLDERFGFHPHTTWSTTTFANAATLLDENGFAGKRERVGVLRTYFTRHGCGPLMTEDDSLRARFPEPHNADAGWQGRFRVGLFDVVAARYALDVAGPVDSIALTHVDRLHDLPARVCVEYRDAAAVYHDLPHGDREQTFCRFLEENLGARVGLISQGPRASDKVECM
jgi:adenylosuccinate synthase